MVYTVWDETSYSFTPPDIRSVGDTGLSPSFLSDLVLKVVYYSGTIKGSQVARQIGLPFTNVTDKLLDGLKQQLMLEVKGGSSMMAATYDYAITGKGQARALELIERCTYAGVAPVPLAAYREAVEAQSIASVRVNQETLDGALSHLVLSKPVMKQLGPAVNSGRSIFLFGPPGNGKTSIAESLVRALGGAIHIPHVIEFDGQIIQIYDPTHHRPADPEDRRGEVNDRRWVLCRRPSVVAGGELTLSSLDLVYSDTTRYYEASLQLKANGGLLLIDDFGRQEARPRDLLNRWIVPLEEREDYLNLRSGQRMRVPFDQLVIFSTNMEPSSLVDEAFLRRIRYKIHVPDPTRDEFTEIFARVCRDREIAFDPGAVEFIFGYCKRKDITPRSCHPRDLVDQLIDIAHYMNVAPRLTPEMLGATCESYFVKV